MERRSVLLSVEEGLQKGFPSRESSHRRKQRSLRGGPLFRRRDQWAEINYSPLRECQPDAQWDGFCFSRRKILLCQSSGHLAAFLDTMTKSRSAHHSQQPLYFFLRTRRKEKQ